MNIKSIILSTTLAIGTIGGLAVGIPHYKVWSQEMRGKAALAEAQQDRQIMIEEAEANLEAEKLNAQAEITARYGEAVSRTAAHRRVHPACGCAARRLREDYIPTEANLLSQRHPLTSLSIMKDSLKLAIGLALASFLNLVSCPSAPAWPTHSSL